MGKPVWSRTYDTGGMFNGKSAIHFDEAKDCDLPYLAVVTNGWNGGMGKRHATQEEAMRDLERLEEKMWG